MAWHVVGGPAEQQQGPRCPRRPAIRGELQRLQAVTYTGPAGTFRQTTTLTRTQRDLLTALDVETPKKILDLATHS